MQRKHTVVDSLQRVVDGPGGRRCTITRSVSPDKKLFAAVIAYAVDVPVSPGSRLEDASGAVAIPTDLAEMVLMLRDFWIALPASIGVHHVCESAVSDIDKRIAVLLRDGFFEFSQFLCGLEVVVLELQQHGVVSEQALLSSEKLLVDLRDSHRRLVEVPKTYRSGCELAGACERSDHRVD